MAGSDFTPCTIGDRIRAILDYDGIPEVRRNAYLQTACGISRSTARRLLSSTAGCAQPRRPRAWLSPTTIRVASGLKVSIHWLATGELGDRKDVLAREVRINSEKFLGYSRADADAMARLLTAFFAGHRRARDIWERVLAGQLSIQDAGRIFAAKPKAACP